MKTYTVEELTDLLERHGIEYSDIHDDNPNYFRVEFDKEREVTIELTLSESDLFHLNDICKGKDIRPVAPAFHNRIRYLTRDIYDYKNNAWRTNPLSKSLGNYKCCQSEREFNEEMSDDNL